jgi:hypothetical protein
MSELLKPDELKHRKFFHKPRNSLDGRVLPHTSFVKEFVDGGELIRSKYVPVRLASNLTKGE